MLDSPYEPMPPLHPESSLLSSKMSKVFRFIGCKHAASFQFFFEARTYHRSVLGMSKGGDVAQLCLGPWLACTT